MKYTALIVGLIVMDRVLLALFPFSDEVCKYVTLGAALVAVCALVMSEVKSSRTLVE